MGDMEQYSRYFPPGSKVGVGIPLPNAGVFRDWAIIEEIDEDLVTFQLSRDALPDSVLLRYGQLLELRAGNDNSGYGCRGIIVSEGDAHRFLLRLIGEVVSDELREFYRIDAFLPVKYYVSQEQQVDVLRRQWEERCLFRQNAEMLQKQKKWDSALVTSSAELPDERRENSNEYEDDEEDFDDSWDTIIPLAANVSGGGVRLLTHQGFDDGEYVLLEILVPSPQRVVDVVARVVFANPNLAAERECQVFNTGFQFVCINERDRDAIINHLTNVQLERNRQFRESYLFRGNELNQKRLTSHPLGGRAIAVRTISAIIFVIVLISILNYFWRYQGDRPKGEIERTFEDSVKKYRDKYRF